MSAAYRNMTQIMFSSAFVYQSVYPVTECDTLTLGVVSKSYTNASVFSERVCVRVLRNYTYTLPVSACLHQKYLDVVFR